MIECDMQAGMEFLKQIADKVKQLSTLSQNQFNQYYAKRIDISASLGKHGWVISGTATPIDSREWLNAIELYGERKVLDDFTEQVIDDIIDRITAFYNTQPESNYVQWAVTNYMSGRYTEAAVFLLALLDYGITCIAPTKYKRKAKQCNEGMTETSAEIFRDFQQWPASKTFLLADYVPSIAAFTERVFCDGNYRFEDGIEPPYLNRNWLLHGRMTRSVKRYECVQLMNAIDTLVVIEKSLQEVHRQ